MISIPLIFALWTTSGFHWIIAEVCVTDLSESTGFSGHWENCLKMTSCMSACLSVCVCVFFLVQRELRGLNGVTMDIVEGVKRRYKLEMQKQVYNIGSPPLDTHIQPKPWTAHHPESDTRRSNIRHYTFDILQFSFAFASLPFFLPTPPPCSKDFILFLFHL